MYINSFRKAGLIAAALTALAGSASVSASTSVIIAVPTAWRLQMYNATAIYNIGTPCVQGNVTIDPADTADRSKALYATVLAAKASNLKVLIEYEVVGTQCYVRSFGIDGQ